MKRFEYSVTEHDNPTRCAMEAKWLIAGATYTDDSAIHVTVQHLHGSHSSIISAAFGHERGHGYQFADDPDMAPSTMSGLERFAMEVDAWQRWIEDREVQLEVLRGQFILDCLNSYRRGLDGIVEDDWLDARQHVEDWAIDDATRDALHEYEPLEPEEGDVPACAPQHWVVPVGGEPYTAGEDRDDEDDEQGDDGPDKDWDDDEPAPPRFASEKLNERIERERAAKTRARDSWLATAEGQRCTRKGQRYLAACLRNREWNGDDLPPVTQALLREAIAAGVGENFKGRARSQNSGGAPAFRNKNGEYI